MVAGCNRGDSVAGGQFTNEVGRASGFPGRAGRPRQNSKTAGWGFESLRACPQFLNKLPLRDTPRGAFASLVARSLSQWAQRVPQIARCIRSAASTSSARTAWLYRSMVMLMVLWPSRAEAALWSTPEASMSVAAARLLVNL